MFRYRYIEDLPFGLVPRAVDESQQISYRILWVMVVFTDVQIPTSHKMTYERDRQTEAHIPKFNTIVHI